MVYLISKILIFLLLALLLGWFCGSAFYRSRMRAQDNAYDQLTKEQTAQAERSRLELERAQRTAMDERRNRQALDAEIAKLNETVTKKDNEITAVAARVEALEESLDRERAGSEKNDADLRSLREEHQRTLNALRDAERKQDQQTTQIEVLTRDRDTWQTDAQSASMRAQEVQAEVAAARARAEAAEAERLELRVQLDSAQQAALEARLQNSAVEPPTLQAQEPHPLLKVARGKSSQTTDTTDVGFFVEPPEVIDDLKKISGVGPKLEKLLNRLGVYQFRQIAGFTREQIDWVDEQLSFKGRIDRDGWVEQAKQLEDEA